MDKKPLLIANSNSFFVKSPSGPIKTFISFFVLDLMLLKDFFASGLKIIFKFLSEFVIVSRYFEKF